jgi:hypothetical protein
MSPGLTDNSWILQQCVSAPPPPPPHPLLPAQPTPPPLSLSHSPDVLRAGNIKGPKMAQQNKYIFILPLI